MSEREAWKPGETARILVQSPWEQATALLSKISTQPDSDMSRQAFDRIKGAVSESYYSTEVGLKDLGWNGSIAFAPPSICG